MIDTIVFDMGNVLLEWNVDKILNFFESDSERIEQLKNEIFLSGLWEQVDAGVYTMSEGMERVKRTLDHSYFKTIENIFYHWYLATDYYADMQMFAKELSQKGYQLYILSNTSEIFYQLIQVGYLPISQDLNGYILSYQVKALKPSVEIYHILLEKYQLTSHQCLFVDDIETNVLAAQKLGMQGVCLTTTEQAIKDIAKILRTLGKYANN